MSVSSRALFSLLRGCFCAALLASAHDLNTRQTKVTIPAPVALIPSDFWDGIDGPWSSFEIEVGTPAQTSRVFASWLGYQTWVIHPFGCAPGDSDCADRRGGLFNSNQSTSWDAVGLYGFAIQQNLGIGTNGNAYFGYDTVSLPGVAGTTLELDNTTVGGLAVNDFYLGILGLNPKPTNFTDFSNRAPSMMTLLKEQGKIPSVSFGYTGGARYRGTPASLTLGGYDTDRFESNNARFTLGPDNSRDTMIGLQSITATSSGTPDLVIPLLPQPIYALVDATVAELWLPIEACLRFEEEFGLVLDADTDLYLVNTTLHNDLLDKNATISMTIGVGTSGGATATIDFPYAAFDLSAVQPYSNLSTPSMYFPLRRAANDTQYTLGRTFMQEAYISVDYERAKFNVSKVVWSEDPATNLVAIMPTNSSGDEGSSSGSRIGVGAIVGIVVGIIILLVAAGVTFTYWQRRKQRAAAAMTAALKRHDSSRSGGASSDGETVVTEVRGHFEKAELDGNDSSAARLHQMHQHYLETSTIGGSTVYSPVSPASTNPTLISPSSAYGAGTFASEKDGQAIYEMPGDMSFMNMADSKQITEKDMMRHREKQYNGYDPVEDQKRREEDEVKEVERQRKAKVNVEEVREATEEEGGNRRFSFIQGQDTISPITPKSPNLPSIPGH